MPDNVVRMHPRAVPPMRGSAIARAFGEPAEIIDHYAEFELRIAQAERDHEARARRLVDRDCAERMQAVEADTRRDLRYARWSKRVTVLCVGAFYLVLFVVSFQIGRML